MVIGINILYLIPGKSGGTETYLKNILHSMVSLDRGNTFVLYLSEEAYPSFIDFEGKARIILVKKIFYSKLKRILYEQFMLPRLIIRDEIDVLFSPGYVVPIFCPCKHVVTVHDMLYKRYPATIPLMKMVYWSIFIPLSFWRSSKIIAVSEFVRKEFEEYFPRYTDKFIVSYESVDKNQFYREEMNPSIRTLYHLPEKYALCVATLSPHKNLEIVLKAVSVLKNANTEVNVVIVGNKERSSKYLESLTKHYGIEKQISFIGFVPNSNLRSLYSNAAVFIMPSLYEGFGLPVLEAMACGCPVVCSNVASLPEVGGGAVEYSSPTDAIELSSKIKKVYFNKIVQDSMQKKGYSHLTNFEWNRTASITMDAIESAFKR